MAPLLPMDIEQAQQRVRRARVGRLATSTRDGRPHLVPCCFALTGSTVYTAVDAKPKTSTALRRIDNIRADARVSLLVDNYDEDWSQLWWVRVDGLGRVVESAAEEEKGRAALLEKYSQYIRLAMPGPVIAIDVQTWRAWP
jgi:PPOX class probable F420-dependent enzyme